MMLDYLGEDHSAARLSAAVEGVYSDTEMRTRDLGGDASTTGFVDAVVDRL